MTRTILMMIVLITAMVSVSVQADDSQKQVPSKEVPSHAKQSITHGAVTIEGHSVRYKAVAGTIILKSLKKNRKPTASMFYVAYMKSGVKDSASRPITFVYNGGPGSSTMWLHMGAFGPERAVTADHRHTRPAPYRLVNNDYSLLDASDLVFIDEPSTGFSRIIGKDEGGAGTAKQFYGVDQDAGAFAQFIVKFLSEYGRWNSPKFLFGESYGTMRSAVLADDLETEDNIDLNGVILLSTVLNEDISHAYGPNINPGHPIPYALALPSDAATAWYHHKLPRAPRHLKPFLKKVEKFAMTDYVQALQAGATLTQEKRKSIAGKLHLYTGLPVSYIEKSNLRITGLEFEKSLLSNSDQTVGRLDSRFAGPTMDPLSETRHYDPQSASIGSAYVALFNNYVRKTLKFGDERRYRPEYYTASLRQWDWRHQPPGVKRPLQGRRTNVMPDLAHAMKYNPHLKVLVNAGYFDLATPFYAAIYTMRHVPIPQRLENNIQYRFYKSGHMVYVHLPSLRALHDNVASFIKATLADTSSKR